MRALLTGGAGMLGSAIAQSWHDQRPNDELVVVTRAVVDLRDREATAALIADVAPDSVIHAAAKVGGIAAKLAAPTDYLFDNLLIDSSVIGGCLDAGVRELLYIGSAAMYPEDYPQPFSESDVLAAPLERANEGYALAKIAGSKLCEYASTQYGYDYRVAVPSNLYGPGDDFSAGHAHLVAAVIAKVMVAKAQADPAVIVWGDGTARREFTYSVDLATWLVAQVGYLAAWPPILNLGVGVDHSITDYYEIASRLIGYDGVLEYDTTQPAGASRRLLDSGRARLLGWNPTTTIEDGMASLYGDHVDSKE